MEFMAGAAVVAWRGSETIGLPRFHADIMRLAGQLPETGMAINLCEERYAFMVGFCATLYRGHTTELPSSRAPQVLESLSRKAGCYFIVDADAQAPEGAHALAWDTPVPGDEKRLPKEVRVAADALAANLYTSGSTGQPVVHAKHWGMLVQSARLTGRSLGLQNITPGCIVSCVPAQHMFGFEISIVLPLIWGWAFDSSRPFFPQDIANALSRVREPRLLVTTPLHIKACVESGIGFPKIERVITATAPLSPELAAAAEEVFGCPVIDIYGSTETGVAATRRTACEQHWHLLEGYRLQRDEHQWRLHLPHYPGAVALSDEFEVLDDGDFLLKGRSGDLIKVGGKRTSLAELNRLLLELEGVEDGVIFIPDGQVGENRPAALVVAPTLDEQAINRGLSSAIDPVFIPRPILFTDKLPRNATGKLPRAELLAEFESRSRRRG